MVLTHKTPLKSVSQPKKNWTPPQLVEWITKDLESKGFPPPYRSQAEHLVSHALGISRLDIYLQYDKPCTAEEQARLREFVKRRHQHEPTAYIMGHMDFWSLKIEVGPGVLIPRQDTEVLVEAILKYLPSHSKEKHRILELGTGTAAIPLALCSERDNLEIVTVDCSSDALEYAQRNIENHLDLIEPKENVIQVLLGDCFTGIHPQSRFDLIVSNPPYIPSQDINGLHHEVKHWEPDLALNGGACGTKFYQTLKHSAHGLLKAGGILIFEHGFDQREQLKNLVSTGPEFSLIEEIKDYGGLDRVLAFRKNDL